MARSPSVMFCVLLMALQTVCFATQAKISQWKSVTVAADAEFFGEVNVKAAANGSSLTTLTVRYGDHTIEIPDRVLRQIARPNINSICITTCPGSEPADDAPYLAIQVELRRTDHEMDSAPLKTAHFVIRRGVLTGVYLSWFEAKYWKTQEIEIGEK